MLIIDTEKRKEEMAEALMPQFNRKEVNFIWKTFTFILLRSFFKSLQRNRNVIKAQKCIHTLNFLIICRIMTYLKNKSVLSQK